MSNDSKHAVLADLISKACADRILPEIAKLSIAVGVIQARLDMIESLSAPPKRATRVAAKPAGAKGGAAKSSAKSTEEKVTNALLFFRYALKNNLDDFREIYADENTLAEVASVDQVAKKDRVKDEAEFYSAAGAAIWKNLADKEDVRKEIRAKFDAWKQEQTRATDATPLEEEEGGEE